MKQQTTELSKKVSGGTGFSQMKLQTQGLIFVVSLLICELALISTLMFQVHTAQLEALHEERSKEILARIDQFGHDMFQCYDKISKISPDDTDSVFKEYRKERASVMASLDWIHTALADQKSQFAVLSKLTKSVKVAFLIMDKGLQNMESLPPNDRLAVAGAFMSRYGPKLERAMKSLEVDYPELQRLEKDYVERDSPAKQKTYRELTMQILSLGFAANIALAIIAAMLFTRGITSKITILVDNTTRLSQRKPLNQVLTGNDEISGLDQVFHNMADALDEAQKVRQAFVAMISHELRTPLTSVNAFLQLQNMDAFGEIPPKAKESSLKAERSVRRLIELINDLLDMEKLEAGQLSLAPKPFYLEDIIERSIEAVSSLSETLKIGIEATETNVELVADPDRIVQVLVNLMSNAMKFSPAGEKVTVETIESDSYVEVRVIDRGRGVPEKYRDIIFERFKQVEAADATKKGGTGLGLPICKAIIEQHDGTIGVNSQDGAGSTFWFRLPLKASR